MKTCLDLFCGAGGATNGLQRAGFRVTGVDINPQPRYCGDDFIQGDALTVPLDGYDLIWASPPCQHYSQLTNCRGTKSNHPDLIARVRDRLKAPGTHFLIENVNGARMELNNPLMLCGAMFGLMSYRHRRFESNHFIMQPDHPPHKVPCARAGHWEPGKYASVTGNCSPVSLSRIALGIDWMNRNELSQAIPPAFSEYLGTQIMQAILAADRLTEKQI